MSLYLRYPVTNGGGGGGTGNVVGPASSTDLSIPLFDGTTGKLLKGQNFVTIDSATRYLNIAGNCDGAAIGPLRIISDPAVNHLGCAFTLDASAQLGGNIFNFLSTGPDAGPGAGRFAIYGSGLGYIYQALPTGQIIIGINNYTPLGMESIYNTLGSGTKGVVIRNAGGQSVNSFEVQASTGTELAAIDEVGNVIVNLAGSGLKVKGGSDSRIGTATLIGGWVTVPNTSITASTRIIYAVSTAGGTQGFLSTTRIAGVSFTITSTSVLDTSTIEYFLVEEV